MIYLDNSATTRPCSEAVEAMTKALTENWGNPSALYDFGIRAARELRTARHAVAAAMGAEPDRVFFTSGGTEADNWAVFGTAKRMGKRGKHIVTTAIEHHAILNCMKDLESQGFSVTYLQPDSLGRISVDALKAALRKDTILVSVMMVNNEAGSVMPIQQMARLTHRLCPDAIFHTDAVQGFLKVPFSAKTLGADLISVSSHKIHGPKGCGALYISPRLKSFPALLQGGGQEEATAAARKRPRPFSASPPPAPPCPLLLTRTPPGKRHCFRMPFPNFPSWTGWSSTALTTRHTSCPCPSPAYPPRTPSIFCKTTASAFPPVPPVPRAPQPCAGSHGAASGDHGRLLPGLPVLGHHRRGAGHSRFGHPGGDHSPGKMTLSSLPIPPVPIDDFAENAITRRKSCRYPLFFPPGSVTIRAYFGISEQIVFG